MMGSRDTGRFIGCSTDQAFVDMTCTMLSSIDDNGGVADAVVMVAAFDLDDADRHALRMSAGSLGAAMQFVAIGADSPKIVARPDFDFPLPLIGRFILPGEIKRPGARMVLVDSDMIVNSTLAPLFEMDMQGHPVAAIHDPLCERELHARGRQLNPDYFNAGLLVLDLDLFNARKLGEGGMRRLAEYPVRPEWLDQDALNDILGADWLRLDRTWNLFYAGDPEQFSLETYEAAHITHFAGAKPTESSTHPATELFRRHEARARDKRDRPPVVSPAVPTPRRSFLRRLFG